ncbi:hypothetical protein AMAG_18668 [Allomyces macrogynus ATCC 38327]|uniref:Uncharacterized protein n=1 Tax=Allomyces macrogynus (strain ATCC 38327) TaxID=578462 RepID=A0A0L0SGN0_ALLM3|nr:hypothetical protein AMAG_18668 [Allomyces macrogynus ATCC 38327]|eukprot:KNE61673.1 hypothetical protein AMAG_18668 [Allomyces macrogynus ATCC 38327]
MNSANDSTMSSRPYRDPSWNFVESITNPDTNDPHVNAPMIPPMIPKVVKLPAASAIPAFVTLPVTCATVAA